MVSVEQLTALIEFMECHTEVALGRLNRSKEGRNQIKRFWEQCAAILNSVSADCVSKTTDQWRVYYNEYKCKLMKKIKTEKAEIKATGGGPSRSTPLTPLQERLYNILGRDFGEPLPGIRHDPLSQHDHVPEVEVVFEIEVVDDAAPLVRPLSAEQEQEDAEVNEEVVEIPQADSGVSRQWRSRDPPACTSRELASDATASASRECATDPSASTRRVFATGSIPSTSRELPPDATPDPIRQATPAAPRRRRRRQQNYQATENEPAMRQASDQLEAMERLNAEVTRELAQATHRQAAALETIAEVLRELVNQSNEGRSPRRRVKRIRVIYSSDSD